MAGSVAFMRILDRICYILHLANRLAPWRFHQHPTRLTSPTPKWKWGKCYAQPTLFLLI